MNNSKLKNVKITKEEMNKVKGGHIIPEVSFVSREKNSGISLYHIIPEVSFI